MSTALFLEQSFNGLQYGMMLFLMVVGVTLVFGVMRLINLAHGAMFMVAGYLSASAYQLTGSFLAGLFAAAAGASVLALVLELTIMRRLYQRSHLEQLLATFGITMFMNELVVVIWGREPIYSRVPDWLSGQVDLAGIPYPAYRLAITLVAAIVGALLYWFLSSTRGGMLVRAGADNRRMLAGLGVNVVALYTAIFTLSAFLAALAGMLIAPLVSMQSGAGDPILILTLTIMTIGGVGSLRGAFVASLLVGMLDTYGRMLLPQLLGASAGNTFANMLVYAFMAAVIVWRPTGLFASKGV
jgi:branched-chain amino acid transport system permease protein